MTGKIYLVGAGPGNLDYLTIKAQNLIATAEVLIYDALVDPQLLRLAPETCLKLNVGKRGGGVNTPQESINQLLVAYCLQGKQVIRLKSGDPFIFGRANEEIDAIEAAGCPFELIPGISSAIAAPLLAGIPLTDKNLSSAFVVLTAHEPDRLDWQAIAKIDTLVILMGGKTLQTIIRQLLHHGRSPLDPIAIIRDSSRAQQNIWKGTLTDILDQVSGVSLSPTVMVIGKVVELQKMSNQSLPLAKKTILVTRAAEQSSDFAQLLQQFGARVIEMPALEIIPPSSWDGLDKAIANLAQFNWLILTSANAVEYFCQRLTTHNKDVRALAGIKIAVVGKKTASYLKNHGLTPDFIPPNFVADSLVENFPENLSKQKILFPRVESGGRDILVKELTIQGAEISEVSAYQSACPQEINPEAWGALNDNQIDIITFASSKTVSNFYQLIADKTNPEKLLKNVLIASIGPQTSKTCQELFHRVDIEATEYTLEGLTKAIIATLTITKSL